MRIKQQLVCSWIDCSVSEGTVSITIFQQVPTRLTEGTIHLCPKHKVQWRKLLNSELKEGEQLAPKVTSGNKYNRHIS